jgi:hypothetical protein
MTSRETQRPARTAGGEQQRDEGTPIEPGWSEGGCHCGRVRVAARGAPAGVLVCNCSICTRKAYLHWIIPVADFRLLTPLSGLATYSFNTGVARHHFCPTCGCAPFYIPRSDPDKVDVNVRCLDGVDLAALKIDTFDGAHWEAHYEIYRAR